MDLEIVMNAISNNCKNTACQKEIGKAIKTYCRKLFQGFPVSTVPQSFYQDSNFEFADFYNSSMEIPSGDRISPKEYPILQSYLSNRYNALEVLPEKFENKMNYLTKSDKNESYKNIALSKNKYLTELSLKSIKNDESTEPKIDIYGECDVPQPLVFIENQRNEFGALRSIPTNKKKQCFLQPLDIKNANESEKDNISGPLSMPSTTLHRKYPNFIMENDDSNRNSYSLMKSCKKPKNLHEFKKQLKDAQIYPGIYPDIFTDPKSQFLSTLGLVPKRICSKKILTKFTKEQRKKRLMEKRRSWFMVDRKVLRDRNKLNKRNSHRLKMRHEAYGNFSKPHSSLFYHSSAQSSQKIRNDTFKKLKNITKRPLRGHNGKLRMIKQQFILPKKPSVLGKKNPEIIDIASSDDECADSQNFKDVKTELPEPEIQITSSNEQSCSFQYADPMLFGCNAENEDTLRSQMFYGQNFGYNGIFGAPNLFLNQNNVVNFPVTSNNLPYQHNEPFYINSQTQFPIMRPFLIPALSNSDIAVLQAGNFPMIRPLRPINSPNVSPYFKNMQPLPKSAYSFNGQPANSGNDEQCLFVPGENVVAGNKESSINVNPMPPQNNQLPQNFKVFLVNKTPKKTYLLVPPSYKAYLNSAKKTIPVSDGKQPIAPRISSSDKVSLKYKTVSQELHQRRLNNAIFGKANYSSKQKGPKKDIQSEMTRLSNWISQMKTNVTPTNFHRGVEKFSHRLTNQLNVGITLVKGVRNALIEIEKNEDNIVEDAV
ncbi:uncharacterized protein LOC129988648 isoform X2 [Argiope bruennichi]|nr:uncharacterized protein LOC129988648 isoform X2 [Argiope bruennichi]XP_055952895.1 uncharacterized protein LOC129988648 isoform X2 [Argiope bruennichi]